MGYCIDVEDSRFAIKRENIPAALKAVKAMAEPQILNRNASGGSYSQSGRIAHYAFVHMDTFARAQTLQDALDAWRWVLEIREEENGEAGDAVGISFEGEKMGDDLFLFQTLAPFVEEGSYIDFHGEDGEMWRWLFSNGKLVEQQGTVTYS